MAVDVQTNGNPDLTGGDGYSFIYKDKNQQFWQWGKKPGYQADPTTIRYYPYPLSVFAYSGKPVRVIFDQNSYSGSPSFTQGQNWVLNDDGTVYPYSPANANPSMVVTYSNVAYSKGITAPFALPYGASSGSVLSVLHIDGTITVGDVGVDDKYSLPGGRKIVAFTAPFALENQRNGVFAIANGGSIWQLKPNTAPTSFMDPPAGVKFMDIGAGYSNSGNGTTYHTLFHALDSQGQIWGWEWQKLGGGTSWTMSTPQLIDTGQTRFMKISDDGMSAIDSDGNPWLMSTKDAMQMTKEALPDGNTATQIATTARATSFAVIDSKGRIWTRGTNASYQLGDGTATDRDSWGLVAQNQFNNGGTDNGGTTIACAPTTGVAPTGLTTVVLAALSMLFAGLLVSYRRFRNPLTR